MSGTSLDGLDVACCEFEFFQGIWHYKIVAAHTYPYSEQWRQKLETLSKQDAFTYAKTHVEYGHLLGYFVKKFMEDYNVKPNYISSHGHTIFHQPDIQLTSQIGDGAALAAVSGLGVICDFRSMDVALNAQGAPLVPIGDKLLFPDYEYCLNIGGIANISFDENNVRKAYDISVANMVLNYFAQKQGLPFDKDGLLAKAGEIQPDLLEELNAIPYYAERKSKSLGREWFDDVILPIIARYGCANMDILTTLVEHIAFQIGQAVCGERHGKMLLTGGGAKNKFLTERIAFYIPNIRVIIPDELLVDYKEAMIFAFLAYLRLNNKINCLKTVTGAKEDHVAGAVFNQLRIKN